MSLRQIQYFVAVANAGSLSAGARRCNVSQPAFCVQIRQLEERLGAALLSRHPRGVELTSAGRVFLPHALAALDELKKAESAVNSLRSAKEDEISLGLMPTPGRALVVDLLAQCNKSPDLPKLRFRVDLNDQLRRLFADGELDAVICYDQAPISSATAIPLYRQEFFLVGPRKIVRSIRDLDCASLGTLSLVLGSPDSDTRRFIDNAMHAEGVKLQVAFEIEPTNLKRELLLRQGCCSIVPYGTFCDEIAAGELCARPIKPALTRTVALAVGDRLSATIREFLVQLICSAVKKRIRENQFGWRTIETACTREAGPSLPFAVQAAANASPSDIQDLAGPRNGRRRDGGRGGHKLL
jgi:LysR family transcriptional regulator, nitrogen assimilation regulatory protein